MTMHVWLPLLGLWLILPQVAETKRWPWHRSSCSHVNCAWGGWSAWGACNHPCGNAGTRSRSRRVSRSSSCGGSGCNGPSSQTQACNRFCYNSGTPRTGHCDCPDEFWGTCCEKHCTTINNCRHVVCTSGTNQQCRKCEFDHGGVKKAFRLTGHDGYRNRICEKICSWRSDSIFCYPGKCPGLASSCQCAPGFGQANCLTITAKPSIAYCLVTVRDGSDSDSKAAIIRCEKGIHTVKYINIIPHVITVDLKSTFTGPSNNDFPIHYYVNDFKVGVIETTFSYTVKKGGNAFYKKMISCNDKSSQISPTGGVQSCLMKDFLMNITVQHTDRLLVKVYTKNGGFVKINNFDSGATSTKYYIGQAAVRSVELICDQVKPIHCSVESVECGHDMLDIGPPITKSRVLTVRWSGWTDSFSGIQQYRLMLYKMDVQDGKLSNSELVPVVNITLTADEDTFNSTLTEPGVYAVLLSVEDMAGNEQIARRFFIFDDKNAVSVNRAVDRQLRVRSADKSTSYVWLTSQQDSENIGEKVEVTWRDHFANEFQHKHKFLGEIAPNSPPIPAAYEKVTGQPPDTVSREAIPNVNAVVRFDISFAVDHLGGRSLHFPGRWIKIDDFQSQHMLIDIPRVDGDAVRVWVRATDVMGNTKTDSVLVHVDSSPPVIQTVRQVETQTLEPFHLKYKIDVYDFHSGVKEINWQHRDSSDPETVYESGHMSVRGNAPEPTDCVDLGCYCIPKDNECYLRKFEVKPDMSKIIGSNSKKYIDYELDLKVTNNAMLTTSSVFKYTKEHTATLEGTTSGNVRLPMILGGSAVGFTVLTVVVVTAICCLFKKSRKSDRGESNGKLSNDGGVATDANKYIDTDASYYTSLQFNNPQQGSQRR